jgi:phospholipase/carboxylesterase
MPGIVDITALGVAPDKAKVLCIFVHGRDQSPEEMEAAVIRQLSTKDVAYVLPRADGGTWYHARAIDPLTDTTRAELAMSREALARVMAELQGKAPGMPLALAGFSQGACLSLELAFAGGAADCVVAFTGCRVGVPGDDRPASLKPGLPVYLSAGSDDPWIPLPAFAEAAVELGQAGAVLRMDVLAERQHAVSAFEIAMLDGILSDLSAGRALFAGNVPTRA